MVNEPYRQLHNYRTIERKRGGGGDRNPLNSLARPDERNWALLGGNPYFILIPYQNRTIAPQGNARHLRKGDPSLLPSGVPLDST